MNYEEMKQQHYNDLLVGAEDWAINQVIDKVIELENENAKLREALKEISTTAHCIAKAGPLNTPTLQDAWGKFMAIDAMATKALSK
jgi:hypothetical protein